jgi:putative holliday junction resolvase
MAARRSKNDGRGTHSSLPTPHSSPVPMDNPTTIMGFDYGTRRIGLAVGNIISRSARALEVLANGERGPDWMRLETLLREWRPDALLVGLPLTVNDSEQVMSRAARNFAAELETRFRLPVTFVDERHSSREAAQRFAARRAGGAAKRKHAATLDAEAAAIIVERWLEHA